jgi:hypothetical protein
MYTSHKKTWSVSKILIIFALLISGILAYITYFGNSPFARADETDAPPLPGAMLPGSAPGIGSGSLTGEREIVGKELLALLDKIEGLSIDTSLFSDTTLINLEDFSVAIATETPGRVNPFAPLPGRPGAKKATR